MKSNKLLMAYIIFSSVFLFNCFGENGLFNEVPNLDSPVIIVDNAPTQMTENENTEITVRLSQNPGPDPVTITVTSSNSDLLQLGRQEVLLNSVNWKTGVSLWIAALNDTNVIDDTATVTLSSSGLDDVNFSVSVLDDEPQRILVENTPSSITEGATGSFTIKLLRAPRTDSVTVAIASSDTGAISVSSSSVTFDSTNWETGVSVTLTAVADSDINNEVATITLSSEGVANTIFYTEVTDDDSTPLFYSYGLTWQILKRSIWIVGGSDGSNALAEVDLFDPVTSTWYANVTQVPTPRSYPAVVATLDKIFVIGGLEGSSTSDKIEYYNPLTNTWTTGPPMLYPRSHAGVVADKGTIGIIAGKGADGLSDYWVTEYNYFENSVYYRTTIGTTRHSAPAVHAGGYYFTLGGVTTGTTAITDCRRNPLFLWGASTALAAFPVKRYGHSAVFYNNYIYTIGGIDNGTVVTDVNVYDTENNNWTNGSGASTPDLTTGRYYGAAVQINGLLYYFGGTTDGTIALSTVETLDLTSGSFATETFTVITSMPRTRMGCGAVRLEE